jgi:hypothetical protein
LKSCTSTSERVMTLVRDKLTKYYLNWTLLIASHIVV